jgi:phosphatidylglycerol---prolipoprotein diacylglyceryl transferase
MHPVLLHIGSLPLNSYGLLLAVSFLLGLRLAARRGAAAGMDRNSIYDLGIWIMMAAIIGSRLFYVLTHISDFEGRWLDVIAIWKGLYGLSMLGGVILAMAVGFYMLWRRKLPTWKLADALIPSFALGILITRIGCFLNGCCFGSETTCSIGVAFPDNAMAYSGTGIPIGAHIHPTQLYESAAGLVILVILLTADRRRHFQGFIFCLFLGLYGATRFGIEEYRYFDHSPDALFGFSQIASRPGITDNQIISLIMFASALVLGAWLYARQRKTSVSSS